MIRYERPGKKYYVKIILLASLSLLVALPTGSSAEEVTHKFRGLTLNANLELAPGATIQDGVVLVLHGPLAHNKMEIIENIQRALADNERSSLAINLSLSVDNRHGFYDCSIPHQHTQEDTIDEIAAWIEWLRQQDVSEVVLLGHSRGANQAMIYAATRKDPEVKQLVLLAPGTSEIQKSYEGRYGNDIKKIISRASALVTANKPDKLMEKTDFNICPQTAVSAKTFLSYYKADAPFNNFEDFLPRLKLPTLITTGSMDERFPHTEEKVSPYADGKIIQLNQIEGADHFFRDFNIDEAMEAAVEFLETAEGT
jgi:pimeloyl-ACP methyl ester carboxylesterase